MVRGDRGEEELGNGGLGKGGGETIKMFLI